MDTKSILTEGYVRGLVKGKDKNAAKKEVKPIAPPPPPKPKQDTIKSNSNQK
jgi:hypothetical protein